MSDILYDKITELVNQYNGMLLEHGVEVTVHRRSFKEEVKTYNHQSRNRLFNMLEYIYIKKKIENEKYHHIPNHYKLIVLQVTPTTKSIADKKECKKYAFLVYQRSRAHLGDKPIEMQRKEQSVIAKIEKRLKKVLDKVQRTTSEKLYKDTLWDSLRYTFSIKYGYLKNYCGKSRFFWEILWLCIIALPILLFALIGLIVSF